MTAPAAATGADVQLEHGHTRIANRLIEALCESEFTGTQTKIVLALWRDTYGWQHEAVKVALPELAKKCNVTYAGSFRRAFDELVGEGVVLRIAERGIGISGTYMVQKDFSRWGRFSIAEGKLVALWDRKPEHVEVKKAAPSKATPSKPEAPKKPAAASWPARAVEIWAEEREGAVVAHGVVGKHLKPVVEQLGEADALERWTRYCRATRGNGWASPANFAAHHPEYDVVPIAGAIKGQPAATSMVR